MKSSRLKSGFILSYTAIFIQSLISIIYTPVMLRFLGQSNYGLLQLAISTIANLGILSFGFGSSYLRFYSQHKAANNQKSIAKLNGMYAMIFISAGVLSLIAGGIITFYSDIIFSASMTAQELPSLKILFGIMTINLALSFPCSIFDSYITAHERFAFQKSLTIIASLLNPMFTFPLLLIGNGSVSIAVCMTLITIIKLIASMIFCIKRLNMKFIFSFECKLFKQLSVFSFFVFLNIVSDQINWNVDKTLLGILKSSSSVTTYSLASQFNSYFLTFSYALTTLFSPKAYRITVQKRSRRLLSRFFAQFGRVQLSVMAYIFMLFIAVGKPFLRLWSGLNNDTAYYTALILISPLLITSTQSIGIEIQRAKDLHRFRSVLYFIIALGNILLSIPLCIKYGEMGCAIGTCLCLVIGNVIIMNFYYHNKVKLNMIYFWKQIALLLPSFILPVAAVILIRQFAYDGMLSIIIGGIIFTIVYMPSVWFMGIKKDITNPQKAVH